jgi:hypothetical protein
MDNLLIHCLTEGLLVNDTLKNTDPFHKFINHTAYGLDSKHVMIVMFRL